MFERILVPVDGSITSERILSQLPRILQKQDAEIILFRAVEAVTPVPGLDVNALHEREREQAQRYLTELVRRLPASGAKLHARVMSGTPAEAILEAARLEGATMIAMSSHGRTGLARWMTGSVAEKVVRASEVPVLLLRSFLSRPGQAPQPAPADELPFRRILVPTDGSKSSAAVVPYAEKLAVLYGAEIVVLHVEMPYVPSDAYFAEVGPPLGLPATATPSSEDPATQAAARRFEQAGLKATRLTVQGEPAWEILERSRAMGADLIAMGTHGRSGLTRWMLGSVTERVFHSSEVPLLIARSSKVAGKRVKAAERRQRVKA